MHTSGLTPPALKVEQITSLAGLQQLAPAWAPLYARSPRATPFASPAWLLPWWKHFGHGPLWTLAAWHHQQLVGLAPMFIHEDEQGQRHVLLVGTGNSDYLDLLAEPGFEEPLGNAVLDFLTQHRDAWDACCFQPLAASSAFLESIKNNPKVPPPEPYAVCPGLSLPTSASDISTVVPANQLKKLHYFQRRASRAERVEIMTAEEKNLDELLGALFAFHQARWNERDLPGVLAGDVVCRFHQDVAHAMLAGNMLRLYGLKRGDRWLAAFYGFVDQRRMYYYLGGFDPAFHRDSPGMLLIGHAIEQALRDGLELFDFLSGQEAYKYDWGARDQTTYRWQLTSSSLPASSIEARSSH